MITFKQFLEESRSAPLYHGTYIENLKGIILDNKGILPKTYHTETKLLRGKNSNESVQGVSTSRSFDFAGNYKPGVVIELDQTMLAQNYKIIPIQFWSNLGKTRKKEGVEAPTYKNEYEEFIVTNRPISVKYIKRIWVSEKYYRYFLRADGRWKDDFDYIDAIRQQYGSSFIRLHNRS